MKFHCQIDSESTGYLEHAVEEINFSARTHDRILKVARTLADLAGESHIRATNLIHQQWSGVMRIDMEFTGGDVRLKTGAFRTATGFPSARR